MQRMGGDYLDGAPYFISYSCIANPCAPAAPTYACVCDSSASLCLGTCSWSGRDLAVTCRSQCAAPDTPVATPSGERPIAELRPGDLVYSIHGGGIAVVPILAVGRTAVEHHHVVRLTLETGRTVEMSAGHPTADGRTFSDLQAGARVGNLRIARADRIPYPHRYTFDILPGSDSGAFFAAGMPVGSTLYRTPSTSQ